MANKLFKSDSARAAFLHVSGLVVRVLCGGFGITCLTP
nr:DUF3265 domain-containing protein [Vibrio cyclitrophicus]